MYTANSMNCLCEAIGIALPGNGTIPAVYSKRLQLAKHAGMAIMDLVKRGVTARQIINERSIRNALTCDMALGCSTNTVLHLLAIAQEAGCPIDLNLFNEISAKTPNLCHLAPAGPTHMPDLYEAGGIPAVQAELAKADLLDLDVPTVTGKTLGENIAGCPYPERQGYPLHRQPLLQDRRPADFVGQHRPGRLRGQAQRRCARNAGPQRPGPRL